MLELIINNDRPLKENVLSQEWETPLFSDSCLVDFQEISPELHAFRAKDCIHELRCETVLEVKKILIFPDEESEGYLVPIVACNFPAINVEKFHEKTGFEQYLQTVIMHQFQLKILGKLLLFCEEKDAVNITFTINETDLDCLEVYRYFAASEERVCTINGEKMQIVIPTDVETYDKVVDHMDKIDKDFRKALWREQNANPAIRAYLKSHSCLKYFGQYL